MAGEDFEAFQRFVKAYRPRFKAIAGATKGDYTPEDIEGEAWLMAPIVAQKTSVALDFDDPFFRDRLAAFLYNELVKYADKTVRSALKLDRQFDGEDIAVDDHPAMRKFAASDFCDPLQHLIAAEEVRDEPPEHEPYESRAGAYLHLLRRFDNRMRDVARHLLISTSYCYFRYNEALAMVQQQLPLPGAGLATDSAKNPKSWRAFRQVRRWAQMELDFGYVLPILATTECHLQAYPCGRGLRRLVSGSSVLCEAIDGM
ncbi:hypothetical protein [Bordetella hinzii]|uniref:hypothetical protein n=1 Tax=Bordetella hinzii TaxID=103855 RepID=UPI000519159F|nr:hypothetical protein [Bordetella hinzii]KXA74400.1 hypothetical protein AXA74_02950 [Bordetella hinzii LMG 13501]QDJ35681.1 hypothetical protein CBR67_02905 [Bordetella hinzii]VEH32202.1 Uncharacterised protein [Bordetella hinzii]